MGTVLGLFGVALFIVCVILIAAAITWTVVKVTPAAKDKGAPPAESGSG